MFHKAALDRELDEEIRAAVQTLADRYLAGGMSPQAAERAAMAALGGHGGILQVKEDVREGRIGAGARCAAARSSLRVAQPPELPQAHRSSIVVTLALGIGANAAIFSVVRAMLLAAAALSRRRPPRVRLARPDRTSGYPRGPLVGSAICRTFATAARLAPSSAPSGRPARSRSAATDDPEQLRSALVTSNFFQVLGVESAIGRTFRPEDSAPGADADGAARLGSVRPPLRRRSRRSSDADIIVNDAADNRHRRHAAETSGCCCHRTRACPTISRSWQPFWTDLEQGPRGNLFLRVIGRMRPGVTVEPGSSRRRRRCRAAGSRRELGTARAFTTVALQADDVREIRGPLLALFVGVAILLLIACVNVASLLIARAASRTRETALRLALGASRGRLLRQSLVEGLLLTLLGRGGRDLSRATRASRRCSRSMPDSLSRIESSRMDMTVLAFTLGISVVWGVLFSLAPLTELMKAEAGSRSDLFSVPAGARRERHR